MNKSALKKYAPQARLDFIAAVTRRAELLGLNPQSPANVEKQGEALLINGRAFPAAYGKMRTTLEARIREQGFTQVMEAMAYTWFNRLVAVRYMELHGFLDHGYRVLSHPANTETGHTQPEILDHIADLELPGLDKSVALELKLAGNKDEELYREVLLAQCHALHQAMPFLFESLDDATELLLPDGLLRTDSILGKLVTAIDEADWLDVEIIGWLYQFYISEKKNQVIGKVVKSEDIPAATQLFTPNWIVKYLVQNSLGRLWLMANPSSQLASQWEYYIKPAEQTEDVNAQLDALIQARIDEDGATLSPESLTLLDPACGSGHILVEAYDLLRDIYLERGYRRQDIPRLILEKNLYGLDIDDRAAQLAGFALLMKARADDRRLFGQPVALNVLALQEAKAGSAEELHSALNTPQISLATVRQLVETFEQAKTFGSLIQVPDELTNALPDLRRELEAVRDGGDMLGRDAAEDLMRLVAQAEVLARKFDAVAANPPYIGSKYQSDELKKLLRNNFTDADKDTFSAFILRNLEFTRSHGTATFMTPMVWMFISGHEPLRQSLLEKRTITSLIQLEYNSSGDVRVPLCTFAINKSRSNCFVSSFVRLEDFFGNDIQGPRALEAIHNPTCSWRYDVAPDRFKSIPGLPIAYWAQEFALKAFTENEKISNLAVIRKGMATGDNAKYVRRWSEVSFETVGVGLSRNAAAASGRKWFPYANGGGFKKWYGKIEDVVLWEHDGEVLRTSIGPNGLIRAVGLNLDYIFNKGLVWMPITSAAFSAKVLPQGCLFSSASNGIFPKIDLYAFLGQINSYSFEGFSKLINPTLNLNTGDMQNLPLITDEVVCNDISNIARELVILHESDWNMREESFDYLQHPLASRTENYCLIKGSWEKFSTKCEEQLEQCIDLERRLNNVVHVALSGNALPSDFDIPKEHITLLRPEKYVSAVGLLSFAIGCMMGRYSLDAPGLIYAHASNEGFDPSRYETFPADDDGIVPITDEAWFDDDGANRIREFVRVVWGKDTEAENMTWLAESLGQKASESADDTIRRYLSRDFYKDHLQTYKKRPIYWLFSSGKHKAFEALVYLHRYNAGTLSRMRMEYVVPLQSRIEARIDNLDQDIQASTSSAEQKRFQKQKDKLIKQLDELRRFDENLRHYADQRITLDLDDGVKVNYGKFGDLLAEVKAVTGKKG